MASDVLAIQPGDARASLPRLALECRNLEAFVLHSLAPFPQVDGPPKLSGLLSDPAGPYHFSPRLSATAASLLTRRRNAPMMPVAGVGAHVVGRSGDQMKRIGGLIIVFLAFLPTSTFGQTSQQYALMGRKLWAAFECSILADASGNTTESQRLFDVGYKAGKVFVEAAQVSKVERQDLNDGVPLAVLMLLHGPTVDFILGRIFEAAVDDATEGILSGDDENFKKIAAQSKYTKMNCSLM